MILVANFPDSTKVPGYYATTQFHAGPLNLATIPLILLLIGLKATASGTATPDVDLIEIQSLEDADTSFGAGSELSRMCYTAIEEAAGFRLLAIAPADGGGVAASATITYLGTAGASGVWTYYLHGLAVVVPVTAGDTATVQATTAAGKFNALLNGRAVVTASPSGAVVTLACKQKGIRGNDYVLYQDISAAPTVTTSTLAGGSAVTGSTLVSGIRFSAGTAVETLTNVQAVLYAGRYNRVVPAQYDGTSLASWVTNANAKAQSNEGRTEHYVFGFNGTQSAAKSLGQTSVNNARFQEVWHFNSESHPTEIAAAMGAVRASLEQSNPNQGYDGYQFATIKPQRFSQDSPNPVAQQSCLDNSVTPCVTVNGVVQVVRAITTYSLAGTTPDYRTLDTAQSVVPDYVRDQVGVFWTFTFRVQNPQVGPDPGDTDPPTPVGTATPSMWVAEVKKILQDDAINGWVTQVSENPPVAQWNSAKQCIMSVIPVVPSPLQHSIGANILQESVV